MLATMSLTKLALVAGIVIVVVTHAVAACCIAGLAYLGWRWWQNRKSQPLHPRQHPGLSDTHAQAIQTARVAYHRDERILLMRLRSKTL